MNILLNPKSYDVIKIGSLIDDSIGDNFVRSNDSFFRSRRVFFGLPKKSSARFFVSGKSGVDRRHLNRKRRRCSTPTSMFDADVDDIPIRNRDKSGIAKFSTRRIQPSTDIKTVNIIFFLRLQQCHLELSNVTSLRPRDVPIAVSCTP